MCVRVRLWVGGERWKWDDDSDDDRQMAGWTLRIQG